MLWFVQGLEFQIPIREFFFVQAKGITTIILTKLYRFFTRVDRILRRSLGVSETAAADSTVKPAPPIDPTVEHDEEPEESLDFEVPVVKIASEPPSSSSAAPEPTPAKIEIPQHLQQDQVAWEVEEIDNDGNPVGPAKTYAAGHHDEL